MVFRIRAASQRESPGWYFYELKAAFSRFGCSAAHSLKQIPEQILEQVLVQVLRHSLRHNHRREITLRSSFSAH
jgi:hypothetical protein